MNTLKRLNDVFYEIEKWICGIGFIGMVAIVLFGIFRREIIHVPFSAGEEITRNLTVIVIFFSAALAVRNQAHVGVEAIINLVPKHYERGAWYLRNLVELILYLLIFCLSCQVLIHYMGSGQVTPISRAPMAVMYACVPIGSVLSVYHMAIRILCVQREEVE